MEGIKGHWIFNRILEGKYLFESPPIEYIKEHIDINNLVIKSLESFIPNNKVEWEEVFGSNLDILSNQKIMLIIGSPNPYDALVRNDIYNNKIIVFDIERIRNYSNITDVINSIVTHEMAHIIIIKDNDLYSEEASNEEILKQLMFDEGFAHYLSYRKLSEVNIEILKYSRYRREVYRKLRSKLYNPITENNFIEGNTGEYWNKYIAISGFFNIIDYISNTGTLDELYNRGYENFWNYWLSNTDG